MIHTARWLFGRIGCVALGLDAPKSGFQIRRWTASAVGRVRVVQAIGSELRVDHVHGRLLGIEREERAGLGIGLLVRVVDMRRRRGRDSRMKSILGCLERNLAVLEATTVIEGALGLLDDVRLSVTLVLRLDGLVVARLGGRGFVLGPIHDGKVHRFDRTIEENEKDDGTKSWNGGVG